MRLLHGDVAKAEEALASAEEAVENADEQWRVATEKKEKPAANLRRQMDRLAEYKGEANLESDQATDDVEEYVRPFVADTVHALDGCGRQLLSIAESIQNDDKEQTQQAAELLLSRMGAIRDAAFDLANGGDKGDDGDHSDEEGDHGAGAEGF